MAKLLDSLMTSNRKRRARTDVTVTVVKTEAYVKSESGYVDYADQKNENSMVFRMFRFEAHDTEII